MKGPIHSGIYYQNSVLYRLGPYGRLRFDFQSNLKADMVVCTWNPSKGKTEAGRT